MPTEEDVEKSGGAAEPALRELDALLTGQDRHRWDAFYQDRAKPCPFFGPAPDESLAQWLAQGRLRPGRAIDLGCGNGRNAIFLARHGFSVEAVDHSRSALDWAAARAAEAGAVVSLLHQDVFQLDLAPGSYDLVYDSGCFHHIAPHRRRQYVELVVRALRPGGWFGLTCFRPEGGSGYSDDEVYLHRSLGGGLGYSQERLRETWSQGLQVHVLRQMEQGSAERGVFGEPFLWVLLAQKASLEPAAVSIDEFLQSAWTEHGDRPQDVADRLAASLHLLQEPGQVAPFVQLLTHVYGEHLGLGQRGVELLETLRAVPAFAASPVAAEPIARSIATLRYADGDIAALDALSAPDRVRALATASSAFAARNELTRAIAAFAQALRTGEAGLPAGSPAIRALAVGGNTLAATLEVKADRSATETEAMVTAARAALDNWKRAGTWLEEERAHYRLARSLLQAGDPAAAQRSATQCVQVCERNDAPAFERFFAHAVLALAARAMGDAGAFQAQRRVAMGWHGQLPDEERKWCVDDCRELDD